MTRTRKSAVERKKEIVQAVIEISGEIGPDRLTTERLAKKIGISQAGIFRHFATKTDIWEAVAQKIGQQLRANVAPDEAKSDDPIGQLKEMIVKHLAFIEATPAVPAILFSRELHSENEKLRAFFAGLMATRQRAFSKLFQAEIDSGRWDKDVDANDAAHLFVGLIQGLAMRWSLNDRNFSLVDEGARLIDLQLAGFEKKG